MRAAALVLLLVVSVISGLTPGPMFRLKAEATQADATQADATQADATQADATQADATQTDATQTDATQTEAPAADARHIPYEPRGFRLQAEAPQAEAATAEARHIPYEPRSFRLQAEVPRQPQASPRSEAHLKISGTRFLKPDGAVFHWRGISAFRLLEFVAHGREKDADAYLRWAASKRLNVVRVFAMADGIFQLSPEDGLRALPRLFEMAQRHGIYVEIVAFTGTSVIKVDRAAFVKAIGAVCARYPNALLELANEPGHPTQAKEMHEPAHLQSLLPMVPKQVPVALGSVEYHEGFAAGTYVTWHSPRGSGWARQVEEGAALLRKFKKPIVNDEPIGAADAAVPGRRDNDPARFRAAATAMRRAGIGATFHYDGGIQTRLPTKVETACLDAWLQGLNTGQ